MNSSSVAASAVQPRSCEPRELAAQDLARGGDHVRVVVPGEVGHAHRRGLVPGDHPQRVEVGLEREVAVAGVPRRHRVALDRVHVDVDGEQVVAALGAVLGDLLEEVVRHQPLALQPALHVAEAEQHRVHGAVGHGLAQFVERHRAGQLALGALDRRELLLRRGCDQVVARVGEEVQRGGGIDGERDQRRLLVDQERRDHGEHREHERDAGGEDAARRPVGPLEVGLARAQHDVREHHQHVGDGCPEHGDVDHRGAVLGDRCEQEADDRGNEQRDDRHLAPTRHRQRRAAGSRRARARRAGASRRR